MNTEMAADPNWPRFREVVASRADSNAEIDMGETLDSLGLDSLDCLALGVTLSDEFGFSIWQLDDVRPADTVGSVFKRVCDALATLQPQEPTHE